jgi:hypothetical protein
MSIQATLMSGKAIGVAAAVSMFAFGAEAMFLPTAMDRSYDRLMAEPAVFIPSEPVSDEGVRQPIRSRYIPLTPIRPHGREDNPEPVS